MSSLNEIIYLNIQRRTTQPTRANFGVPLIAGYFPISVFQERVKSYSSLTALTDEGFETDDPIYLQAAAIMAQNPSPPSFKVGRRALPTTQEIEVPVDAPTTDDTHTVTIVGYADSAFASRARPSTTDTHTLTVTASETDEEDIVDLFVTAFATPGSDVTVSKSGTGAAAVLTIDADNTTMSGMLFGVVYEVNDKKRSVDDVSADPGIATDLAAIQAYDPEWYGLCLDSNSQNEIEAAASWAASASNKKILVCQTQDADVAEVAVASDTTSVAAVLKAASYTNVMVFYHRDNFDMVSGAMLGKALPFTPGSITWAYKQLAGVQAQDLTDSELTILQASVGDPTQGKDCNSLTSLRSTSITRYGSSIQGEFMDVNRYADYLHENLSVDVYSALVNNDKIPLSDAGINAIKGIVHGRLEEGVTIGALLDGTITVTVPRAADISAADRAARHLDGVTFTAQLSQAVHFVSIEGELQA